MKLSETQVAVLTTATPNQPQPVDQIAAEIDKDPAAVTRAAFELEEAGLVTITAETETTPTLTDEGERYAADRLPELRLYETLLAADAEDASAPIDDLAAELETVDIEVALANFARKDYGEIDAGAVRANPNPDPDTDPAADPEQATLEALADDGEADGLDGLDGLERRGLIDRVESTTRSVRVTDDGVDALMAGVEAADTVGRLTPDLLTSGEFRDIEFAEYAVTAEAEATPPGREHVLRQTANRVKDVLTGMGFKEMQGPHVDAQFWINDCLFMPQDHPARTHWDQFDLAEPAAIADLPDALVERVESAHREGVGPDGEGYHSPWERDVAASLNLRGHTTSLSMRYLAGEAADLEPPERYFSVEKVYRNDTIDPTHLLEFFQIEGWVMADRLSARDLMGTFEEFYAQFGITDIEFKPHYNPYTEPSFELFGTHPETDELVEVGNSGLFRDEVLRPLGVEADVMAWGLSLERLLMLVYGFDDIRDVHGTLCDLGLLRDVEVMV